jgi:hypothetical protein
MAPFAALRMTSALWLDLNRPTERGSGEPAQAVSPNTVKRISSAAASTTSPDNPQ